ncbi:MAG: tRNA lysidine(34) synthetase TilS [Muribaculaceae bacterium]|nr:tRNA lysidine(34) synthetase TilS [Muribaculaceae bacterium]
MHRKINKFFRNAQIPKENRAQIAPDIEPEIMP